MRAQRHMCYMSPSVVALMKLNAKTSCKVEKDGFLNAIIGLCELLDWFEPYLETGQRDGVTWGRISRVSESCLSTFHYGPWPEKVE